MKNGLSPFEACAQVHISDTTLLHQLSEDAILFHLVLFQIQSYLDATSGIPLGPRARSHLAHGLRLLQGRLASSDGNLATADSTILGVSMLAMAMQDGDDLDATMHHMGGLARIVTLRGGVRALTHNNHRIQRKVCRCVEFCKDLSRFWSLMFDLQDGP
jgi:hypothetical protein